MYKRNCELLKELKKESKSSYNRLRTMSIFNFTKFLLCEFDLSATTIRKYILLSFGDEIESFNQLLMDDFCNLIEKDLTDFFSNELLENKRGL
jgi:hypothetical protein